jgi:hypothetical protein
MAGKASSSIWKRRLSAIHEWRSGDGTGTNHLSIARLRSADEVCQCPVIAMAAR